MLFDFTSKSWDMVKAKLILWSKVEKHVAFKYFLFHMAMVAWFSATNFSSTCVKAGAGSVSSANSPFNDSSARWSGKKNLVRILERSVKRSVGYIPRSEYHFFKHFTWKQEGGSLIRGTIPTQKTFAYTTLHLFIPVIRPFYSLIPIPEKRVSVAWGVCPMIHVTVCFETPRPA